MYYPDSNSLAYLKTSCWKQSWLINRKSRLLAGLHHQALTLSQVEAFCLHWIQASLYYYTCLTDLATCVWLTCRYLCCSFTLCKDKYTSIYYLGLLWMHSVLIFCHHHYISLISSTGAGGTIGIFVDPFAKPLLLNSSMIDQHGNLFRWLHLCIFLVSWWDYHVWIFNKLVGLSSGLVLPNTRVACRPIPSFISWSMVYNKRFPLSPNQAARTLVMIHSNGP